MSIGSVDSLKDLKKHNYLATLRAIPYTFTSFEPCWISTMAEKSSNELPPKLFISYSWTTPEHEKWVLNLATELCNKGIDVILDKWHLKEGHDAYAFMEKMVTDPDIKKVIMVTDKAYAEKTDSRSGGVGTEAQIISQEVYDKQSQDKFVAVVPCKDEDGKPYLPTYYKARIYIDLSEPDSYSENFERLIRWIINKPLYTQPKIGRLPDFSRVETPDSHDTPELFSSLIDGLKHSKPNGRGDLIEYLDQFSSKLEEFRINSYEGEFDDAVVSNIESFTPFRNEFIRLIFVVSKYAPEPEYIQTLHKFFENIIPYFDVPEGVYSWREGDFDNFKFIAHELLLYTITILIKYEHFNLVNDLLGKRYYQKRMAGLVDYTVFRDYLPSLKRRNERLKLNRLSLTADLLKDRCSGTGIEFNMLMQTDFILYIRSLTLPDYWWPDTLVFAERFPGAFEIFLRATSKQYFDKIKCLLNVQSVSELSQIFQSRVEQGQNIPYWRGCFISPGQLLGIDKLAQLP